MKINFGALARNILIPVATAVIVHRAATGKLDVKGALVDVLTKRG